MFSLLVFLLIGCNSAYAISNDNNNDTSIIDDQLPFRFSTDSEFTDQVKVNFSFKGISNLKNGNISISLPGDKTFKYSKKLSKTSKSLDIQNLLPDTIYDYNITIATTDDSIESYCGQMIIKVKDSSGNGKKIESNITIISVFVNISALKEPTVHNNNTQINTLGATRYESESNNTTTTADQTWDDDDMYGNISTSSDVDYYKVMFSSNGNANFWLGGIPTNCDYDLKLYDSNGSTQLASSAKGSNTDELISQYAITANKWYYIKVYSYSGSSSSNYQLRVKNYPVAPSTDSYESNDTTSSATSISSSTSISDANLHTSSDIDYYKFTLSTESNTSIQLANIPSDCDYDLKLYDSGNNQVDSSTAGGNSSESISSTLLPGTYYIKVYSYKGDSSSNYSLVLSSSSIPMATTITVKGHIIPVLNNSNDSNPGTTAVPLEGFTVQIVDKDLNFHDTLATVKTNSSGYFETTVSNQSHENGVDLFLKLIVDDDVCIVTAPGSSSAYSWESNVSSDYKSSVKDFGTINPATTDDLNGAFSIWRWITEGHNYYKLNSKNKTVLSKATVRWSVGNTDGTHMHPDTGEIHILGKSTDADQFDGDILLHEYGHFIMNQTGSSPASSGGSHSFTTRFPLPGAYSEGWAHLFTCAVRSSQQEWDYYPASSNSGLDLEAPNRTSSTSTPSPFSVDSTFSNNAEIEGNVAGVFWDLLDNSNDNSDIISKSFSSLDDTMLQRNGNVYDFYDQFYSQNHAVGITKAVWDIFDERKVSHDIKAPTVNITKTSPGNYIGSATDDVAVVKSEWLIDGVIKKTINGTPGGYTVPSGLSDGSHTLSLRVYDPEGDLRGSSVRSQAYGSSSTSFTVSNGAAAFSTINDSQNTLNTIIREISKKEVIKNNKTFSLKKSESNYVEYTTEGYEDISIFASIAGAIEYVSIWNPDGELYDKTEYIFPDTPITIKNAKPGQWKIVFNSKKDNKHNAKITTYTTSKPTISTIELPQIVNTPALDFSGSLGKEQYFDIYNESSNTKLKIKGVSGKYHHQLLLQEGMNVIKLKSKTEKSESEEKTYQITLDTIAPDIQLFDATNGSITTDSEKTMIRGLCSNDTDSLEINGEFQLLGEFKAYFGKIVELQSGDNPFTIQATDKAGNTTTKTLSIFKTN